MKKLFYLFLFVGLAVTSCNKPETLPLEQEVTFKATELAPGFKSSADICDNDAASYALITIKDLSDDTENTVAVDIFYLGSEIYTNSLKLTPGDYQVTGFMLYDDGDNNIVEYNLTTDPISLGDDQLVYASAEDDSQLGLLSQQSLPADFTVGAFLKNEVSLDIFCFDETNYETFGFSWFQFNTINIGSDLVFFGDFCTKYFADYGSTLYASQANSLQHDMPAIFNIEVLKDGVSYQTYSNAGWFGEGKPLVVPNPDNSNVANEEFDFVLSILVKVGASFDTIPFYTWTRTDNGTLFDENDDAFIPGADGVIDFVLGSCVPDADLVLPPYMNLPASVDVLLEYPGDSTYWDITLLNVAAGYDIQNGTLAAYCGDHNTTIGTGNHTLDVFSSLYPALIPDSFDADKPLYNNVNWLGNHLSNYPGYVWQDVQDAVWIILGQISTPTFSQTTMAGQMAADALAQGDNFMPPVGGFAAVLFISQNASTTKRDLQLIFTLVDP